MICLKIILSCNKIVYMKKKIIALLVIPPLLISCNQKLPKPEITTGIRGAQFGIDKNINEETIDKYLNRDDVVYRDMRMLIDPANYSAIGGDSYLSGIVEGFEVVPLPYLIPVKNLPPEVGNTYSGETLFSLNEDNHYVENYQESLSIVENLFPKNKAIFLMCGGGGYASFAKSFLIDIGYDKDKIYNVGGYWYYNGKHSINIKKVDENGNVSYDFDKLIYHDLSDFSTLTRL